MEKLINISTKLIDSVNTGFKRFLHDKINWERRLIGIKGARGTGKTTMILQHIKEAFGLSDEVLYISLDNIFFAENKLFDVADTFIKNGGKYLFLDEVHKYPNWSVEIKNIYDSFPELKIVFTGSSILDIDKSEADLSRRAAIHELPVLSLREYIQLKYKKNISSYSLSDILSNHKNISASILKQIKPIKEFNRYNIAGTYPFFKETENPQEYLTHIERIINLILETDMPAFVPIDIESIIKLKRLLLVISESVPFYPNISKLSKSIGVSRDTLIRHLHLLEKARLISLIHKSTKGVSKMNKPDKIFLDNSNLLHALQFNNVNQGTIRETFFLNQLSVLHRVELPDKGDFIVDKQFIFEIGGKNKTQKQIYDAGNSYIVADNIEFGYKNKIPLWLFGFLY